MKIKLLLALFIATLLLSGCALTKSPTPSTDTSPETTADESTPTDEPAGRSELDLSGEGLTKIPGSVFDRTGLEKLDVSDNQLTGAIQAEIRHLQNLKVLNASNNQMTGLPAEIGQLSKLEVLDLSNNQLTGLPYELGNLKNLKVLNISGNNYSAQDLAIIEQGLPDDVKIIK